MSDFLIKRVDLVVRGFVFLTFYHDYMLSNRFFFKNEKLPNGSQDKFNIRKNIKESELESVKKDLIDAINIVNPKANVTFEVRDADSSSN